MTARSTASSRDAILGRIRKSVDAADDGHDRRVAIQKHLYDHTANIVPQRARQEHGALVAQFEKILQGQSATVARVSAYDDVPAVLANFLREHNLPARIRHGADARLRSMDWTSASQIDRLEGPAQPDDAVSLSHAFTGASETGTMFLVSGEDNPTTLNFLPETHVIVLAASQIAGSYEDAWSAVRASYGERAMPRTVNMISGPSRTGDIEQVIIMGAHGPKRMLVVIVEDEEVG